MTTWTLLHRGLRFYWRTHLGTALGAAVGTAVLVGALVVGDSVSHSLRALALRRLGKVRVALTSPDRFFRDGLAEALTRDLRAPAAPALQLPGVAAGTDRRANDVQVLGVDGRFWALAPHGAKPPQGREAGVILNERLAAQLRASVGDVILLRVRKPDLLPADAPLSQDKGLSVAARLEVRAVASAADFGRFSLRADQVSPYTAFVPLEWLQQKVHLKGRANLLLVGGGPAPPTVHDADAALRKNWRLADAGVTLHALPAPGAVELRSGRVFIDPPVARAAADARPGGLGILTYFVNEIRRGDRSTPYSMVTAAGSVGGGAGTAPVPAWVPAFGDDQVAINQWLADDLQAKPGDEVELTYFVLGPMRRLSQRTSRFKVARVLPMSDLPDGRTLMPEFPGLAEVDQCRNWSPGVPIDLGRIRPKDEQYWDRYRGTPKAFVTLSAGRKMWANRFGDLTAVRWAGSGVSAEGLAPAGLAESVRRGLDPAEIGLFFRDVRGRALAASDEALPFGWLFFGLSFFLIAAAVLLMGLLFVFGVEQRTEEIGTLISLGWPLKKVRRALLAEGVVLAAAGALIGVPAGAGYTRALLGALATVWRGAVAGAEIRFHARAATLIGGGLTAVAIAVATMWLLLRRQGRAPVRALLAGGGEVAAEWLAPALRRPRAGLWVGLGCALAAAAVLALSPAGRGTASAGAFFASGALLLLATLGLSQAVLSSRSAVSADAPLTVGGLGFRNAARRPGRSLATVALLSAGSFLIVAVGANRLDPLSDAHLRSAGTGGFALLGTSALPVVHDLNDPAGQAAAGIPPQALKDARVVPLRVRQGDDASCLNLNRAQQPTLLGVRPEDLRSRRAFTFVKTAAGLPREKGWLLLNDAEGPVVPAIGDEATVTWALGKSVGETLEYLDERGRRFQVRIVAAIANSVLQGSLVISEDAFVKRFPSQSGYRMFLIDAPPHRTDAVAAALTRAGEDVGMEVTPAPRRLAEFNAVQNSYLSIFQVLGGLGLVLGSVGLGIVLMRNLLERRGELGLLQALGFGRGALHRLVLWEHWGLLLMGLAGGVASALVAVLPALRSPGAKVPYASLTLTLAAVLASGLLWTWLATLAALRGPLLPALRNE